MATYNAINNSTNFTQGFCALKSSTTNNITGDGTGFPVIFDSEVYDRGNVYNDSTGVFTVPITGFYYLQASVLLSDINSGSTSGTFLLVTTSMSARLAQTNPYACAAGSGSISMSGSVVIYLTTADTAYVTITLTGGTKTTDLIGSASMYTYFTGIRVG